MAGFPDHPHRGFETVTYMLAGSMEHKDHRGNHGNLVAGSVQMNTREEIAQAFRDFQAGTFLD